MNAAKLLAYINVFVRELNMPPWSYTTLHKYASALNAVEIGVTVSIRTTGVLEVPVYEGVLMWETMGMYAVNPSVYEIPFRHGLVTFYMQPEQLNAIEEYRKGKW